LNFKTSIKKYRLSEKNESEIESQNENMSKDDLIVKKIEIVREYEEIKSEEETQDDFELISIKNEVIDTEYEINENVNKTQKEVDNHEIQINKQNDEDSMVVNTRKRRLLQGHSTTTCEQINNKRKSETVSILNESLTSESTLSVPSPPPPTIAKQTSQKYEIFKPTIKMSKKEPCSTSLNASNQQLNIHVDSSDEYSNNESKTNSNSENMFESIKNDVNESGDCQSKK
jgi:hypothetical protein